MSDPDTPPDLTVRSNPDLLVRGRNLDDVTTEALAHLRAANDPPKTFLGPAGITRLRRAPSDDLALEELDAGAVTLLIARAVECMFTSPKGERIVADPPRPLVAAVTSHERTGFPPLVGIARSPLLRADGTVVAANGYDAGSRLWFDLDSGLEVQSVAERPSRRDVVTARKVFTRELLGDFTWADNGPSLANAVGMVVTPVVRLMFDDIAPLHGITANQQGTGKGLLAQCGGIVATGHPLTTNPYPSTTDELRKLVTSLMRSAPPIVVLDNVDGIVRSRELARLLTSPVWGDRLLGVNTALTLPNRTLWTLTGNAVRFGGDLARRVVPVLLASDRHDPWNRSGFRHPHLRRWTAENRGLLLWAIFTLARSWIGAGRPAATTLHGGYETWSAVVGGILDHAGIDGHLTNLGEIAEQDWETTSWVVLLEMMLARQSFAGQFSAPELVEYSATDSGLRAALADVVPREVSPKSVGEALARRAGRWHRLGDGSSCAVDRAGVVHGGARAWLLRLTA